MNKDDLEPVEFSFSLSFSIRRCAAFYEMSRGIRPIMDEVAHGAAPGAGPSLHR
jgi:hypothetical protein